MVTVIVRKRNGKRLASGKLVYNITQILVRIVRPFDIIGQIYQKSAVRPFQKIHVRAVVEMRLVAFRIESLSRRILRIAVLYPVNATVNLADRIRRISAAAAGKQQQR